VDNGEEWTNIKNIPAAAALAAARGCPTGNSPMAGRIVSVIMEEARVRTHHRRSRIGKSFRDQHLQWTLLDTGQVNESTGKMSYTRGWPGGMQGL